VLQSLRGRFLKRNVLNLAKALLVVTLFLFGRIGFAAEEDYATRFAELKGQKDAGARIDALLDEWRAQKPNDPDAWITSANYYFNQSVGPTISTKQPDKGDYGLTNKKTGKAAGSISFKPGVAQTPRQATDLLQEAITKFPDRLDIWCGLAFIDQESGDFDGEVSTLRKMVAYARDHPADLKWLKGEKLPASPDQFIPDKLHSYALYYEKKENPEDDKRFMQIATFSTEQFPNHPYAFNDVAMYYSLQNDNAKTREWLEKANKIDPSDTLVMTNLGYVCAKLGDTAAARKWYEAVIKAEPNGEHTERAKEALRKLKKK
jgi:tetratricopeptide (TPR) repeat protein